LLRRFASLRKRFVFVAGNDDIGARLLYEPFAKMIRSAMTKRRSAINARSVPVHLCRMQQAEFRCT
jgi:hypothetical protein